MTLYRETIFVHDISRKTGTVHLKRNILKMILSETLEVNVVSFVLCRGKRETRNTGVHTDVLTTDTQI